MRIVTRCCAKPAVLVLTGQHERDRLVSREGFGVAEKMKGGEAPVETIQAEVFGQPVFKLIFALWKR